MRVGSTSPQKKSVIKFPGRRRQNARRSRAKSAREKEEHNDDRFHRHNCRAGAPPAKSAGGTRAVVSLILGRRQRGALHKLSISWRLRSIAATSSALLRGVA